LRAIYDNHLGYANEAAGICTEYFVRKSLASLGFTFRGEDLSYKRALDLHMVAGEVEVLKAEIMESKRKKK
jgi:hypothetical protein